QCASVIGKDFSFGLLHGVAGLSEENLRQELGHLHAAEVIYETQLFPDLEYTFKHALTHEVAYGSLLQDRRKLLHARVVDAIEVTYADRLEEHTDQLAYHALRGEVWTKAVAYWRRAGQKAYARSAHREAVSAF